MAFRCVEEGSEGVGQPVAVTATAPTSTGNRTDSASGGISPAPTPRPSSSKPLPGATTRQGDGSTSTPSHGGSPYSTLTKSGKIGLAVGLGTSAVVIGLLAYVFRRRRPRRVSNCQAVKDTLREAEGSTMTEDQARKEAIRISERVINHWPRRATLV